MAKIHLDIVSPEKPLVSAEVDEVLAPGLLGEFGILPGHTTLLSELGEGRLVYVQDGQSKTLEVSGGFAEVCGSRMTVMVDAAQEL